MDGLSVRMSEYPLFDRCKWFTEDKITELDVNTIQKDNPAG